MGRSALALCFGSHVVHNFVFMFYPHALIIIALREICKCKSTANFFLSILRKCNIDFPHVITLVIHICNSIPKVNPSRVIVTFSHRVCDMDMPCKIGVYEPKMLTDG
jgi:hypothetical protein